MINNDDDNIDKKSQSIEINFIEAITNINTIERKKIGIMENIQESEADLLRRKKDRNEVIPINISTRKIKKDYLEKNT